MLLTVGSGQDFESVQPPAALALAASDAGFLFTAAVSLLTKAPDGAVDRK